MIQTDAPSYLLAASEGWVSADVAYTFTNTTGATVYIVNCLGGFELQLERLEAAGWRPVWSPVLSTCVSEPIVVADGAAFSDTLSVVGALPATGGFPEFDASPPAGTYRMVWQAALSTYQPQEPFGDLLPLEDRTSNSFVFNLQ